MRLSETSETPNHEWRINRRRTTGQSRLRHRRSLPPPRYLFSGESRRQNCQVADSIRSRSQPPRFHPSRYFSVHFSFILRSTPCQILILLTIFSSLRFLFSLYLFEEPEAVVLFAKAPKCFTALFFVEWFRVPILIFSS